MWRRDGNGPELGIRGRTQGGIGCGCGRMGEPERWGVRRRLRDEGWWSGIRAAGGMRLDASSSVCYQWGTGAPAGSVLQASRARESRGRESLSRGRQLTGGSRAGRGVGIRGNRTRFGWG